MCSAHYYRVLLSLSLALAPAPARAVTNRLAICLVASNVSTESLWHGTAKAEGIKPMPPPIFSDTDFISYDRGKHKFAVTAEAAKRFANRLHGRSGPSIVPSSHEAMYDFAVPDTPFVLMVAGKPIYLGVFSCPFSSCSYLVPVIVAEAPAIGADSTNSVSFSITRTETQGEAARTDPRHGVDVRNDKRVLAALKDLGL